MTTNQRDYTWIGFTPRLRTSIDMQIHADIQMYMNKKEKRFCARTCHIIPFAAVRRAAVGWRQLCVNSTFFSYSEAIYNPLLLSFSLSVYPACLGATFITYVQGRPSSLNLSCFFLDTCSLFFFFLVPVPFVPIFITATMR